MEVDIGPESTIRLISPNVWGPVKDVMAPQMTSCRNAMLLIIFNNFIQERLQDKYITS